MGIGQISVSSFPPAYPYGPPESDLKTNLEAITKFAKANADVQKQKYENQLLKALLGLGQIQEQPGAQPGLAGISSQGSMPSPPPVINADPSGGGAYLPRTPVNQPTPPQGGLASLAGGQGGIPIPDVMRDRFNPPPGPGGIKGLLGNIGNAFNPAGQYRGAPTGLESLLLGERLKQMTADPLDRQYKQAQIAALRQKETPASKGYSIEGGFRLNKDTGQYEQLPGTAKKTKTEFDRKIDLFSSAGFDAKQTIERLYPATSKDEAKLVGDLREFSDLYGRKPNTPDEFLGYLKSKSDVTKTPGTTGLDEDDMKKLYYQYNIKRQSGGTRIDFPSGGGYSSGGSTLPEITYRQFKDFYNQTVLAGTPAPSLDKSWKKYLK